MIPAQRVLTASPAVGSLWNAKVPRPLAVFQDDPPVQIVDVPDHWKIS
jgi:hypothetical protein